MLQNRYYSTDTILGDMLVQSMWCILLSERLLDAAEHHTLEVKAYNSLFCLTCMCNANIFFN